MKEDERLAIGRRTKANIKRGKTIRIFKDGTEHFDDYWTDSDGSDDTLTTLSGSKSNNIREKLHSGLATESNSGDIKNQGSSKTKTSLSKRSVSVPDSEDVVSSSLTGSKHPKTSRKSKLPENVSAHHSKELLSNSVSNSEKSSQDVTSSPLTRSKHKAYYQKVNSPSTNHLQLKKGRFMQPSTKPKYHSVKKRLADDFTKLPENISPHHSEKSLSNSHSDSEKSSQDLATSVTRSRHTVYDQQFNTPSARHNLRKTVGKYPVDNFKECPVTVSTQCQTSNHEQSMLTSNVEKSVQVLSVDVDDCLSDSGHNLNENPVQSSRQLSYNKEKSLDLINAKELKMHRKVKWLSKSNVNSRKSVTVTQSTAVSSKSPVQSPENFQFRKKKNPAVIRSDTEDENFDHNSVRKVHKFKSKIPVKIPASLSKGTNSYHITGNDFSSNKISEIVERKEILETVVNNEIINSRKKMEQKNIQSSLNKNLKRRKKLNASRVSPRISALSNNNNLLIDDNEAEELPNKKQIKTTKRINKNLLHRKKQQRKSYPSRCSALYPSHPDDASVPELPSQRENLHSFKSNDKHTNKKSESQCSKTEHRYISRSGRVRYSPLAFWKNERIQFQFQKDGNISVLGVEKCFPVSEQMKNKVKKTVSETQSVKASIRTHEFINETENKDLTMITVFNASTGKETEANLIRPFSSLTWKYPQHENPDYDDYIMTKSFQCSSANWGFICIKRHRQKPAQFTPDQDIYFSVIKGKVEVELHTSKFVLKKGGSFIVPHGNIYSITNVYKSNSILIYNVTSLSIPNIYSEE